VERNELSPVCNTGDSVVLETHEDGEMRFCGTSAKLPLFSIKGWGIDTLEVDFGMEGSGSIGVLNAAPQVETRFGNLMGEQTSWGEWSHPLGQCQARWRPKTSRLKIKVGRAPDAPPWRPEALPGVVEDVQRRMAMLGWSSYEIPYVRRYDVAVDAVCSSEAGRNLLDGLASVRLPNGLRTETVGRERSTVYFKARVRNRVLARSYCRNLKRREGEPFGEIRLESQHLFGPEEVPLESLVTTRAAKALWEMRFGGLSSRVSRLPEGAALLTLREKVMLGEMGYAQAERMNAFLVAERLGVAHELYPPPVLRARRREARDLGLAATDPGLEGVDLELGDLLQPFASAFDS
jgi:hypothetical protein